MLYVNMPATDLTVLHICTHAYIYIYTYMIYKHLQVCKSIHICMHMYVYVRICMYMYVRTHVRTYVRTYVRRYVCMHACMRVCIPVHKNVSAYVANQLIKLCSALVRTRSAQHFILGPGVESL